MDDKYIELNRNHLWDYFRLHAEQRVTLFRFYVAFCGLFVTGVIFLVTRYPEITTIHEFLGIVLAIVFIIITAVFQGLDARNRELIKYSEEMLQKLEKKEGLADAMIFNKELEEVGKSGLKYGHTFWFKTFYLLNCFLAIVLFSMSIWCACYYSSPNNSLPVSSVTQAEPHK